MMKIDLYKKTQTTPVHFMPVLDKKMVGLKIGVNSFLAKPVDTVKRCFLLHVWLNSLASMAVNSTGTHPPFKGDVFRFAISPLPVTPLFLLQERDSVFQHEANCI